MKCLLLPRSLLEEIIAHLEAKLPEEACGLLTGSAGKVSRVIPIANQAHSRLRFSMDPAELARALIETEANRAELLAVFHSHPSGPDRPSESDLAEHFYTHSAMLIFCPGEAGGWRAKAYRIERSRSVEIPVTIVGQV